MTMMKHRSGFDLGGNRLSDQGKALKNQGERGRQGGKYPDGVFDRFYPGEKSIWIHISPFQQWEYEAWNPESSAVEKVIKTWFQSKKHYHPRTKRTLICSAGSHIDQPCFPCAIRRAHWKKMNAIEERTGVKPKDEPPVGIGNQYSFSIVIMENVVAVPAMDKKTGEVRKSKAGKIIYNYYPEPVVKLGPGDNFQKSFGRRAHLSMGKNALLQLLQFDEEMKNYCAHCATQMTADAVVCPECDTSYALPDIVKGEDLVDVRQRSWDCSACHYSGWMQPHLSCSGCGSPEEGRLTNFDIRIKRESVGEKQSVLRIAGVRMPLSTLKTDEQRAEVQQLIENPLNLPAIFSPSSLEDQKKVLGELCIGIDPRSPKRDETAVPDAAAYGNPDDDATHEVDEEVSY
jgi:hypothetical protein